MLSNGCGERRSGEDAEGGGGGTQRRSGTPKQLEASTAEALEGIYEVTYYGEGCGSESGDGTEAEAAEGPIEETPPHPYLAIHQLQNPPAIGLGTVGCSGLSDCVSEAETNASGVALTEYPWLYSIQLDSRTVLQEAAYYSSYNDGICENGLYFLQMATRSGEDLEVIAEQSELPVMLSDTEEGCWPQSLDEIEDLIPDASCTSLTVLKARYLGPLEAPADSD